MTVSKSKRLSFVGPNWAAMVLVVCFGMMAVLGTPFHDHDFDPSHSDSDCASCYLASANIGLEQNKQDIFLSRQEIYSVSIELTPILTVGTSSVLSRAPPIIWICFFI